MQSLKLELPAAAWGRQGVCRFRIVRVEYQPAPDMTLDVARYKRMLHTAPKEPPDPVLGRTLFVRTCQECHTLYGLGARSAPT